MWILSSCSWSFTLERIESADRCDEKNIFHLPLSRCVLERARNQSQTMKVKRMYKRGSCNCGTHFFDTLTAESGRSTCIQASRCGREGRQSHDRCLVFRFEPIINDEWTKVSSRSSVTSVASPSHETSSATSVFNTSTSKERRLVLVMVHTLQTEGKETLRNATHVTIQRRCLLLRESQVELDR